MNCVWVFKIIAEVRFGVKVWREKAVFLTSKEALNYGCAYGEKGKDWDVYGVPCKGKMANILGQHNKEFESEVGYIS